MVFGFVAIARALPNAWPAVVAAGAALIVLLLSFVAPMILEPIFNKFRPLADEALAGDLRALSVRAGVPVREVLVADASRRTRKENAYVSGLGRTRRVVLYDTLVAKDEPAYVRLVVAHEMGHRRMRHVAMFTMLGMAGAVVAVLILWGLLSSGAVLRAIDASGPGDPRVIPFLMLAGAALQFVGMPFLSTLSRRSESAADRFSLDLVGDLAVFEHSHRALAVSNLSDLDPPRLVYLMAFSHPTAPQRIAAARHRAEPGTG
jgi:STE24 endopeptidase